MDNESETNAFAAHLVDDRQYRTRVASAPVKQDRTFDDDAATAATGRAARKLAYTVLAVDDDELARAHTVTMLENLRHTVLQASSGEEALEVLRREPAVDLLVTTLAMPHMSGLDLCSRAQSLYPSLRFVLAMGRGDKPDYDEPALLRLPKPFLPFELARVVEIAMDMAPWSPRIIWL